MKHPLFLKPSKQADQNHIAFQGGSYSLMISAIVLALLVVINVFVSILPTNLTKYDISASKLYSITSNTKVVVNALEDDVTIYWIVQSGEEDAILENLLGKYESLSDHIHVVKKNPDIYPTFAQQYTDETVQNNSLVVECGDRSRFIGNDDIYLYQANLNSYSYDSSFDGEGAITSAIDYVVHEDQPQLYLLEGHGESDLPEEFQEQLEKENIQLNTFSLLTVDTIPEEADCVMIYAPESDISQAEQEMLADYVSGGGKLLVLAGPTEEEELTNLSGLLADYGVSVQDGIVVEGDRAHYAFQSPLALLPDMASSSITDPLMEDRYFPIFPVAQGLLVGDTPSGVTVTQLLTTSESSFSKLDGFQMSTFEKEEGDVDGPFAVAVSIDCPNEGQIVYFSSSRLLEELYNAYSSGANMNLTMNALSSLIGESEAMAIRSKSLNYNYLTISDSTSSMLEVVMIGVFPLLYLGVGIFVVLSRRRMQHESN
ncbi:MAG: GldG family protein [Lawsonibacter sp.]|jgi:ABC-2 type transport system permease protein